MKISYQFGADSYDINSRLIQMYGHEKAKLVLDKTGPKKLMHASPSEDTLTLGISSLRKLLKTFQIDIKSIRNLVSVTETPYYSFPGNAAFIAANFPFEKNISIYDLNAGCTGFVDAIKLCMALNEKTVIICSETYSKHIKKFSRSTSCLFSDGSAAILVDPEEWNLIKSYSIISFNTFNDISLEKSGLDLKMDGQNVFNFVASEVMPCLIKIFEENKNISRAYIHQGSKLVVNYINSRLENYNTNIPTNICKVGNFVSATLPILISNDVKKRPLLKNETILLVGFGVGLSLSACILNKK
jgi:3-oxoacyl-[acyl-carrier-protein] synthase-3